MTEDQFEKLMLDIIKGVFEEKNEKHFIYSRIFRKLMQSNKQNKLKIGKYLLGRLIRESYGIFIEAQRKATMNCPYRRKTTEKELFVSESFVLH